MIRAELAFEPPRLIVDAEPGSALIWMPLREISFIQALDRVRGALAKTGLDPTRLFVRTPGDLPTGPIDSGEAFTVNASESAELARWFQRADSSLAAAAAIRGIALPVPCWADHFDLALVVQLDGASAPPDAQVTLGFSPGDGSIPEPYFYVTPWPITSTHVAEAPAPAGGRWQVEGWIGLALTATAVLESRDPVGTTASFLERGFEIARDLVLAG